MYISLGCALENMAVAASAHGFYADVELAGGRLESFAGTADVRFVARVDLTQGPKDRTALYRAIPLRHTNRGAYDPARPISQDQLDALVALGGTAYGDDLGDDLRVFLITDGPVRQKFNRLMIEATKDIIADHAMVADSNAWFRMSSEDIQKHRDGPTLEAFGLSPLVLAAAKMLPPPSAEESHELWLEATRDVHLKTAPVTGFVAVRDLYDVGQALRAGRLWQRMHLWATTQGLAMHPMNQPLEVVDRERQLKAEPRFAHDLEGIVDAPGWRPTFAFRLGHPTVDAVPSPRRDLSDRLI